jgi:hypothetical protein
VRNQHETCEAIGLDLSEDKKKMYFMGGLHTTLFASTLVLWNSFVTRFQHFPDTFDELVQLMIDQHSELSTSNPALVARCERKQTEQSFGSDEKSNSKQSQSQPASKEHSSKYVYRDGSKCPLCKEKHNPSSCKRFNKKYSLENNMQYWKKRNESESNSNKSSVKEQSNSATKISAAEEDDEKWVPTKGTIVAPPATKKSEKNNHMLLISEPACMCFPGDEDLISYFTRQERLSSFVGKEQIVFTLDTGTETGTVDKNKRDLLTDIINESVSVQGVSGSVNLTEIGSYVFGKARVLHDSLGRNLVSLRKSSSEYQLINPDPYTLIGLIRHLRQLRGILYAILTILEMNFIIVLSVVRNILSY